MKKIITVIDLGSSKIAAATAGIDKTGRASVLALENLHSRGIKGGEITDINKAVEDISSIVGRLQRQERRKIKNVFVTAKCADIKMVLSQGMVPLSRAPREIEKRDVEKCLEVAAMVRLSLDRAIMQTIVKGFYIDQSSFSVRNPVGLYGIKLEVEVFIATANQSRIQNITKCVDHAGLFLNGIYLSSIACADSVLDEKEKENGVLLLDIGGSLTEQLIFKNDMLKDFHIIQRGASDTLDSNMCVDKQRLMALLKEVLARLPAERGAFSSIVVTGGGALLDNIIEEAENMLKAPTRIGIVKASGRNLNSQDSIIHTSTIGLIKHLAKEYKICHTYKSFPQKAFHKILDIYESYF